MQELLHEAHHLTTASTASRNAGGPVAPELTTISQLHVHAASPAALARGDAAPLTSQVSAMCGGNTVNERQLAVKTAGLKRQLRVCQRVLLVWVPQLTTGGAAAGKKQQVDDCVSAQRVHACLPVGPG